MTTGQFKDMLAGIPDDLEVTVSLAPSGHISGSGTVKVGSAYRGCDWEHGQFVIRPERDLDVWYGKCRKCAIPDDGRVTSNMTIADFKTMDRVLQMKLDGKLMFSVPYPGRNKDRRGNE